MSFSKGDKVIVKVNGQTIDDPITYKKGVVLTFKEVEVGLFHKRSVTKYFVQLSEKSITTSWEETMVKL